MAIKKRKVPKRRAKPKPKLSAHELVCRALYNRLQAIDPVNSDEVREIMDKLTPVSMSSYLVLEYLTSQCDTEIKTYQINGPRNSYQVCMKYTDRTKKPLYGYLYPSVFVVKTSPVLIISVMLAYIELAKNLGRWPHEKT